MMEYYFSHSRTALKYGLIALGMNRGDLIHLPDFICDVVLHPLEELGIPYKYYRVTDELTPDWDELAGSLDSSSKAIMMVNYFGQPQNMERFLMFCKENNLKLIEDNAHGFGGHYNGQLLGSYGDIGISSPRKTFELPNGGVLYVNDGNAAALGGVINSLPVPDNSYLTQDIKSFIKKNYWVKRIVRKRLKNKPRYDDPRAFCEAKIEDMLMSRYSSKIIHAANSIHICKARREVYEKWEEFSLAHGLKPVFDTLNHESCPLAFPVYTGGAEESKRWFDWGWDNGFNVYSWPSLPDEIIKQNGDALHRWKRLVCFPIEEGIERYIFLLLEENK